MAPGGGCVYDCRESSNIQSTEKKKTHSGKYVHNFLIEMNLASDLNRFEFCRRIDRPAFEHDPAQCVVLYPLLIADGRAGQHQHVVVVVVVVVDLRL